MIRRGHEVVWSFESAYGYPYIGTDQQRELLLLKAGELGGIAIDPRTGRRITAPK